MEGNLRFKIDWISLIAGNKPAIFALFYFIFEGNFPNKSPPGAYIWRGDLTDGFLRYRFGGLIFYGSPKVKIQQNKAKILLTERLLLVRAHKFYFTISSAVSSIQLHSRGQIFPFS